MTIEFSLKRLTLSSIHARVRACVRIGESGFILWFSECFHERTFFVNRLLEFLMLVLVLMILRFARAFMVVLVILQISCRWIKKDSGSFIDMICRILEAEIRAPYSLRLVQKIRSYFYFPLEATSALAIRFRKRRWLLSVDIETVNLKELMGNIHRTVQH